MKMNIKELRNDSLADLYSSKNVQDGFKDYSVGELRKITQIQSYPFWVMTLNVLGDLNIATVIRSAHLFGAEKCVIFGRRKIDNRGFVGAANYTPVEKIQGIDENLYLQVDTFLEYCGVNSLVPFFIEQGGKSCYEYDWSEEINKVLTLKRKPILILGTERDGIPTDIIDSGIKLFGGSVISIPQRGVIRSHNLSMAFAIVAGLMVSKMNWY